MRVVITSIGRHFIVLLEVCPWRQRTDEPLRQLYESSGNNKANDLLNFSTDC